MVTLGLYWGYIRVILGLYEGSEREVSQSFAGFLLEPSLQSHGVSAKSIDRQVLREVLGKFNLDQTGLAR